MHKRYVAYGLDLRSSFPLPGMTEAMAPELPSLALERRSSAELLGAWGGAGDRPAWSGRLSDGSPATVERGFGGEYLFTYGDHARFRLHTSLQRLECASSREGLEWQRALIGKVLPSAGVMRGYEGLHAAAVESEAGVVAFAGASGAGKSTLAREFLSRGWRLFADDVVTLSRETAGVRAHPATPHITLTEASPGAGDGNELTTTLGTLAGERWASAEQASRRARPLRMLCLLRRGEGLRLGARVLPANPLLLAPHMLGFSGDGERQRRRFHLYADLMGSITLLELTGAPQDSPRALADVVERVLEQRPALARRAA